MRREKKTDGRAPARPRTRVRPAYWLPLALILWGCGGKVVFEPEGGADGTGGSEPGTECVANECGEPCTKCAGDECFAGECSDDGFCMRPETPPVCPGG